MLLKFETLRLFFNSYVACNFAQSRSHQTALEASSKALRTFSIPLKLSLELSQILSILPPLVRPSPSRTARFGDPLSFGDITRYGATETPTEAPLWIFFPHRENTRFSRAPLSPFVPLTREPRRDVLRAATTPASGPAKKIQPPICEVGGLFNCDIQFPPRDPCFLSSLSFPLVPPVSVHSFVRP